MRKLSGLSIASMGAGLFIAASLSSAPSLAQVASPPPAATQPAAPKEVSLTDKQIQDVLSAQKDFGALVEKLPKTDNVQPDAKLIAEFEATAKKNGFASYADYNSVVYTMSTVLNGFDPKTKAYVGPEAVLKQQLAAVQADTKLPANDKKAIVEEINAALKSPPPAIGNKVNIDIVGKNYDKIAATLKEE